MTDIEMLAALLDNALSADERRALETRLAAEPPLVAQLGEMQRGDDLLRAAFDAPMKEPVPQRLLDLLAPPTVAASAAAVVAPRAANDNSRIWLWGGGAIAAGLALVLVVANPFARSSGPAALGDMAAFGRSLDTTPSTQLASLGDGRMVQPQLTFARQGGGYCRQFKVSDASGMQDGVACREGSAWNVKALVLGAKAAGDGGYATAGGLANRKLDAEIAALRGGDPLDPAAERLLIGRGWQDGQ